ncbi:MAG: RNA methyltransferase [Verrucomicrobiota bacterium]
MPVTVVLDRLRSAFNVGNIFRVAEALRVEEIIACGYTAHPPHPKVEKTARGCDRLVSCRHVETAVQAVCELRSRGVSVYAVETVEGAVPVWDAQLRFPAALVLGNEALGVSADVLAHCDGAISLPRFGCKNSINVGNCAAVVLYHAARIWHSREKEVSSAR